MKEGDVIGRGLVPTDQNAPEAVQPTMSVFHHPASGFEPSPLFDGLCLFPTAADVGRKAKLVQGPAQLSKVVAFIRAQTLGMIWAGCRSGYRQAAQRRPYQLHVVAVGAIHCQPHGNTLGFGQQAAFHALLTPIRGVGAGFPPAQGGLGMAPSRLSQLQSSPFNSS